MTREELDELEKKNLVQPPSLDEVARLIAQARRAIELEEQAKPKRTHCMSCGTAWEPRNGRCHICGWPSK